MQTIKTLLVFLLLSATAAYANDRFVLHYDSPANDKSVVNRGKGKTPSKFGFMQTALPLGNGRLGAMFTGGIETEHLMLNDITLWMNATRGLNPQEQSGARSVTPEDFEKVRQTYRDEKFGSDPDSMESISTEYLSSKLALGNYGPFTDIWITTGHDPKSVTNYRRALDCRTGLGSVSYSIGKGQFNRELFCSFPHDIVGTRYTAENGTLNLVVKTQTKHAKGRKVVANGNRIVLTSKAKMQQDDVEFIQVIHIDAVDGEVTANEDGSVEITGATDVRIYVAGYTDYLPTYPTFKGRDFKSDSEQTIQAAITLGYDALKQAHVADVSELMDRCHLELDTTPSGMTTDRLVQQESRELENLYFHYSRYLQLSCSRNAPVPSNLQGLWNESLKPSWNCDYHTDINLAMNYWMVETANLPGSFRPYVSFMKVVAESGKHSARETFGIEDSWSMGLNGNVYGFTGQNPHGRRNQQAGHWLAQHLFEHYAFGGDKEYLEEVYPIMKGAAAFFVEYLAPWKDGTLVVYPTWSPENAYSANGRKGGKHNKQCYGAAWDQQMILNLFTDCIEASYVLDTDAEFREKLQSMIPKLCPQKIGKHGQLQEWPDDRDDPKNTHRHISHLMALHPGRDISPLTTKELYEAALVTMKHRGDQSTGWSTGWKTNFWARLHDGDRAHKIYKFLTSKRSYPNLFDFHPPFQIDGNFGGGAGVCEMLLQSHLRSVNPNATGIAEAAFVAYQKDADNPNHFVPVVPDESLVNAPYILHLLPALPTAWSKGKVHGLRARGGFEVDMQWSDNQLTRATIRATRDSSLRIYSDGKLSETISLKQGQSTVWPATNVGDIREGAKNEALAGEAELYNRKREAFANPKVDNPDLPNVLLIGDSISIGYTAYVRWQLAGKADVYRIKGNAKTSSYGVENLDKWLTRKPANWDVIHFNWGLWDLCYRHPKSKVQGHRDKVNGTLAITPEQYRANMENNVARLKQTNAKLIWCTTTPVPEGEAGRKLGDDTIYNQIAAEIMEANEIQINDLHAHALLKLPEIMAQEGDVHFNETGYQHLADKVVAEILSAIEE